MRLPQLALALGFLVPLAACGPSAPSTPVRVVLAERLPDATIAGGRPDDRHPAAAERDGLLVQRPGSTVTFALPLPAAAVLRGEAAVLSTGQPGPGGTLSVSLRTDDGHARTLAEATLLGEAVDPALRLDADLSAHAGELVALDLTLDAEPGTAIAAVSWRGLAIEGSKTALQPGEPVARDRYNVLVLLLDSLRADHLAPDATPNLTRLAEAGVRFEAARSTSSWTKPSVASLFTSRPPWGHGVVEQAHVLPRRLPYLPEILSEQGWRTVAISATAMFSEPYGFGRGFEKLWDLWRSADVRTLEGPVARADWVWQHLIAPVTTGEAPFFVYLHELDPHSPYEPPDEYVRVAARDYSGRRLSSVDDDLGLIRRDRDAYTDAELEWLNELYRGEVAAMDAYVGRLLEHLDAAGHARDTLVIFVSDHGEEFDDHRSVGHAHTVYDELLRVPLLMRLEGFLPAGLRVTSAVDLLDVAPTVLDLLGLATPAEMQGRSLLPLMAGGTLPARASLASSHEPLSHSLTWGRWKLLSGPGDEQRLYDLTSDPAERRDLSASHPVAGEALRQLLAWRLREDTIRTRVGRQASEGLAPDIREQLQELGYLE